MGLFGLFNKKKESPAQESAAPTVRLGTQFEADELHILAVTGPTGFLSNPDEESGLFKMQILLTAWMEEDSPDICREETPLLAVGDETLRSYLRQRTPSDFIIKFRARRSLDGKALLLTNLPEPGFDPDLKAILLEQKQPKTTQVEGLGTFTLNRSLNILQAEVDWLGSSVWLTVDPSQDQQACMDNARTLMADQAGWDAKLRACAADKLLEQANQWAADGAGEDEEPEVITREDFISRIAPDSIVVLEDGSFQFFFEDGDLFWGHTIQITGTLTDGVTDAVMEG